VQFDAPDAATSVLVEGRFGPVQRKATLHFLGPEGSAPQPCMLSPATDDSKTEEGDTCLFRVTLAKEFAAADLYDKAREKPISLPALVLPAEVRPRVIRTLAAVSYTSEVTCKIRVSAKDASMVKSARLPNGAFVTQFPTPGKKQDEQPPHWIPRPPGTTAAAYWALASKAVESSKGQLAFRPGGGANLGIRGGDAKSCGVLAPRWTLSGAPRSWVQPDAEAWAAARGYTDSSAWVQRSAGTWQFRAWPPEGKGTAIYSSGIVVAPAVAERRRTPRAEAVAGPAWGAPPPAEATPRVSHTVSAAPLVASGVSEKSSAASRTTSGQPSAQSQQPSDGRERSRSPRSKAAAAAEVAAAGPDARGARPAMPHADKFTAVECGGEGDCAYVSIARALNQLEGTPKAKEEDLAPRGRLQARLRCEAAKELTKHPGDYPIGRSIPEYAKVVGTAGTWADSPALVALCQACKLELRIYCFEKTLQRWQLYLVRGPRHAADPKGLRTIWLRLADEHYQWLQPLAGAGTVLDEEVARALRRTVGDVSDPLRGAGKSDCGSQGSATSRAMLGLCCSSSSQSSRCRSAGQDPLRSRKKAARAASHPSIADTAALLGISAAQSRTSTATIRKRPAAAAAADAGSVEEDLDELAPHVAGSQWTCPCGWMPPQVGTNQQRYGSALKHWRDCQGTKPPKATAEQRSKISSFAPGPRCRAEQAQRKFQQWADRLAREHPQAAAAACTPNLDAPFSIETSSGTHRAYTCTKCGRLRELANFRRLPCPARASSSEGSGMTRHQWISIVVGGRQATAISEAHRKRWRRWAATADGRKYIKVHNQKQYLRRKAAKQAPLQAARKRPAAAPRS
jgi:hypothetical protein